MAFIIIVYIIIIIIVVIVNDPFWRDFLYFRLVYVVECEESLKEDRTLKM